MRVGAGAGDHAKAASGLERRLAEPGVTAALLKEVVPAQVHRMLFPGICAFTHDSPGDARVKNTNGRRNPLPPDFVNIAVLRRAWIRYKKTR